MKHPLLSLGLALGVLLAALTFAGFVSVHESRQQRQNCEAIEALKALLRPDPFDEAQVAGTLRRLHVDPESAEGQQLIKQGKTDNAQRRAKLAPKGC